MGFEGHSSVLQCFVPLNQIKRVYTTLYNRWIRKHSQARKTITWPISIAQPPIYQPSYHWWI
jgi:hypothetical protein